MVLFEPRVGQPGESHRHSRSTVGHEVEWGERLVQFLHVVEGNPQIVVGREHRDAKRHHRAATDEKDTGATLGDGSEESRLGELAAFHARSLAHSRPSRRDASPEDVRAEYSTASIVGNERVVFNIRGNKYRLVVAVNYRAHLVFIKFFGTHAEYDRIDVETVKP